jgi:hypothetical protein
MIDANSPAGVFIAYLHFEPALPDGTYSIAGSSEPTPPDPNGVDSSGAIVTGTFTFSRSRDVPFADIAEPEARVHTSTIDASFDLVAVLPHPDPAMGPGCRLETGPQQVTLSVSGPVRECTVSPGARGH